MKTHYRYIEVLSCGVFVLTCSAETRVGIWVGHWFIGSCYNRAKNRLQTYAGYEILD